MHWCPGCGALREEAGCYCDACHDAIVGDLNRRRALPVGGTSCPEPVARAPASEPEKMPRGGPVLGPVGILTNREARRVLREVANQVPCKGSTYYARDAPPSWMENAVRAWEDGD